MAVFKNCSCGPSFCQVLFTCDVLPIWFTRTRIDTHTHHTLPNMAIVSAIKTKKIFIKYDYLFRSGNSITGRWEAKLWYQVSLALGINMRIYPTTMSISQKGSTHGVHLTCERKDLQVTIGDQWPHYVI